MVVTGSHLYFSDLETKVSETQQRLDQEQVGLSCCSEMSLNGKPAKLAVYWQQMWRQVSELHAL